MASSPTYAKCAQLYRKLENLHPDCWPVVYSPNYSITADWAQHSFDLQKYQRIFDRLTDVCLMSLNTVVHPDEITEQQLKEFHTTEYIDALKVDMNRVMMIAEPPQGTPLPSLQVIDQAILSRFRYQTAGTIIAARLALQYGVAINIGGGFHHARATDGEGFCFYADISGALKTLRGQGLIQRALIIDLDAHMGNGHEIDFKDEDWVQTLDFFNPNIFKGRANTVIGKRNLIGVHTPNGTSDDDYLFTLNNQLETLFQFEDNNRPRPDIIAYNAGTDCLATDPLGNMNISDEGIVQRDEMVFRRATYANIPIFMVLSGGYTNKSADVIADSILRLSANDLIAPIRHLCTPS